MTFINTGFGSLVSASRIVAVVPWDSAPIKRSVRTASQSGMLIDASFGRKTRSVLVMDSGHIFLSALSTDTLSARVNDGNVTLESKEEQENI